MRCLPSWRPNLAYIPALLAYYFISFLPRPRSECSFLPVIFPFALGRVGLTGRCLTLRVSVRYSITIGPVAVMSLLTGQIITDVRQVHPKLIPNEIASALAVLCGAFIFVLGIFR